MLKEREQRNVYARNNELKKMWVYSGTTINKYHCFIVLQSSSLKSTKNPRYVVTTQGYRKEMLKFKSTDFKSRRKYSLKGQSRKS